MVRLPLVAITLVLAAATPAAAQLTGNTAATGSVSTTNTGSSTSSGTLGIGLGSGTLSGGTGGAAASIPSVGGTSFGQPGTPLGSQSSLSARVNARAGIGTASRLNTRLATGTAGYSGSGASGVSNGSNAVSGLSAGTNLSNAGQPSGAPLGRGN